MNYAIPLFCLNIGLVLVFVGCGEKGSASTEKSKEKPAIVKPDEANLSEITLTEQAYTRLGITTAKASMQAVAEVRRLGGEIIIPPGESAIIVAPVTGTIESPKSGKMPLPGSAVEKGEALFSFKPLLSPERFVPTPAELAQIASAKASLVSLQMTADGDIRQLTEQVNAAQIVLDRAEKLLADRVGSQRAVDDATAQLAIAEAGLIVAQQRKAELDQISLGFETRSAEPIEFLSPIAGIVRNIPVTQGQIVATGNPIFEIVNLETAWIRVPVYVGLFDELEQEKPVELTLFGDNNKRTKFMAAPVAAPPAADPMSSTFDMYFSVNNEGGRFKPGERVNVSLPLNSAKQALVIPVNAILYDIHGNTWVYEKIATRVVRRARVFVQRTTNEFAILSGGLVEGSEVVVDGAAELFGTEFGTGK